MYTYLKLNAGLHYFSCAVYGFGAVLAIMFMIINGDTSLFLLFLFCGFFSWLFFTLGHWIFQIIKRAENFDRFCEIHKIDNKKTYNKAFFATYKKN